MRKPKLEVDAPKKRRILVQEGPVFNEYNKESIYFQLRRGLHFKHAAQITGVTYRTAIGWREQGKTDQEDFEDDALDYQTEKALFYSRCLQSESEFIAIGVDKLAASEDWRAYWELIKTGDREGYQPSQKIDLNKNVNQKIVMEVVGSEIWKKDQIEEILTPLINDADTFEGEYVEETE